MATISDRLAYNERLTPNGNRYRESYMFRDMAFLAPCCIALTCDEFSPSRFLIETVAEKAKHPVCGKWKWVASITAFIMDVGAFFLAGKFVDKLITNHRMHKADELAKKQNLR